MKTEEDGADDEKERSVTFVGNGVDDEYDDWIQWIGACCSSAGGSTLLCSTP